MYLLRANHYNFPNDIQVHTQLITSDSTLGLICGTVGLRKLLNHTRNIQDIIDAGLVDIIIELMSYAQSKQVQFEATWCIANIAAGTTQQSKILIDGGVVPILLDFIQQNNSGIV
jgi:importin subunit alpha-6/7